MEQVAFANLLDEFEGQGDSRWRTEFELSDAQEQKFRSRYYELRDEHAGKGIAFDSGFVAGLDAVWMAVVNGAPFNRVKPAVAADLKVTEIERESGIQGVPEESIRPYQAGKLAGALTLRGTLSWAMQS